MTVFECDDSFEGILSGVYDAWDSRLGHDNVRLEIMGQETMELFSDYREVPLDWKKAERVMASIKDKISWEAYELLFHVSLSFERDKADRIYRFLIDGYRYGGKVTKMLAKDSVFRIFEINRAVCNERHLLTGFVRFSARDSGLLVSKITPKNNVLPILAPHFADRLSGTDWIIMDADRKSAAFYRADYGWALAKLNEEQAELAVKLSEEKDEFRELWKVFFHTIAIKERTNPVCQRNHLPLRYRDNMPEFDS